MADKTKGLRRRSISERFSRALTNLDILHPLSLHTTIRHIMALCCPQKRASMRYLACPFKFYDFAVQNNYK